MSTYDTFNRVIDHRLSTIGLLVGLAMISGGMVLCLHAILASKGKVNPPIEAKSHDSSRQGDMLVLLESRINKLEFRLNRATALRNGCDRPDPTRELDRFLGSHGLHQADVRES